jgi:hypothetical protein
MGRSPWMLMYHTPFMEQECSSPYARVHEVGVDFNSVFPFIYFLKRLRLKSQCIIFPMRHICVVRLVILYLNALILVEVYKLWISSLSDLVHPPATSLSGPDTRNSPLLNVWKTSGSHGGEYKKWLCSGMLRRVDWWKFAGVSEVFLSATSGQWVSHAAGIGSWHGNRVEGGGSNLSVPVGHSAGTWRRWQQLPPKRRWTSARLHVTTCQWNVVLFMLSAYRLFSHSLTVPFVLCDCLQIAD